VVLVLVVTVGQAADNGSSDLEFAKTADSAPRFCQVFVSSGDPILSDVDNMPRRQNLWVTGSLSKARAAGARRNLSAKPPPLSFP
jgi:hypothetical protein